MRIKLERAVARIRRRAVRHRDAEKPLALDADIRRIICRLQRALREDAVRRRHARAEADLEARRVLAVRAGRRARVADVLVDEVLELRANLLTAIRIDIRDVVRDDIHIRLLPLHARGR